MARKSGTTRRGFLKSGAVIPSLAIIGLAAGFATPAHADCRQGCSSSCQGDCMGGCKTQCWGCDGTCTSNSKN